MQVHLFDIIDTPTGPQPERILSFDRFLAHLTQLGENHPSRKNVLAFVLNRFRRTLAQYGPVRVDNLDKFRNELYYLYNLYVPFLTNEETALWGLAFPLSGKVFYGTDAFYAFVKKERLSERVIDKSAAINGETGSLLVYQLIFERIYGFSELGIGRLVYEVDDGSNLLPRYYAVKVDNSFVEVMPKGDLPMINYKALQGKKPHEINEEDVGQIIPLDRFRIEGFSIISLEDITHEYVIEELKRIVVRGGEYDYMQHQKTVENNLKLLTGIYEMRALVIPILKLNDKPLLHEQWFANSILHSRVLAKVGETQLLAYLQDPYAITFHVDADFPEAPSPFTKAAVDLGLGSLAIVPLFHNNQAVGLLELYTEQGTTFSRKALANLRLAIPLLTQFVNDINLDFKTNIDTIILDRFTALQPAVQWKFNEAAWAYLCSAEGNRSLPQIRFDQVYPLYGAIDIRNSTLKRNEALIADLSWQLELLHDTLNQINRHHPVPQYLIQRTDELEKRLKISQLDYVQLAISQFVNEDVNVAFNIFKRANEPVVLTIIRAYEEKMDENKDGRVHRNRRAFETAVYEINQTISVHLDEFNNQVQAIYPSYFEKFRTDGVEFDCYVGQSISPHIPFNSASLKEIRRIQLEVMVAIAKDTQALAATLPIFLETTQLIFINNSEIGISFREDERRFDVEGAYNIRYHVVKKRIDKAFVKGSSERITQPGKITLVYWHEETLYDYLLTIEELQESGVLAWRMEYLEVEELQGVSGLRALRLTVLP